MEYQSHSNSQLLSAEKEKRIVQETSPLAIGFKSTRAKAFVLKPKPSLVPVCAKKKEGFAGDNPKKIRKQTSLLCKKLVTHVDDSEAP
jgi:hypothetical protein